MLTASANTAGSGVGGCHFVIRPQPPETKLQPENSLSSLLLLQIPCLSLLRACEGQPCSTPSGRSTSTVTAQSTSLNVFNQRTGSLACHLMPVTGQDAKEVFLHALEGREGGRTGPASGMGLEEAGAAPEHPCRPCSVGLDACNPFKFSTQSPRAYDRQRVCFYLLLCLLSSTSLCTPGSQAPKAKLTKSHVLRLHPTPNQLPRTGIACPPRWTGFLWF